MSLNRVILMGRLAETPELKQTQGGTAVTSFSVAVDRNYGGEQKQTDFLPVTAWKGTAEFVCRYFQKGSMLALEGSLQSRQYEDKQGNRRTVYEVVADQVYFAGRKSKSGSDTASKPALHLEEFEEVEDGNLPF